MRVASVPEEEDVDYDRVCFTVSRVVKAPPAFHNIALLLPHAVSDFSTIRHYDEAVFKVMTQNVPSVAMKL